MSGNIPSRMKWLKYNVNTGDRMLVHCLTAVTGRSLALPFANPWIISSISELFVSSSTIERLTCFVKNDLKSGSGSIVGSSLLLSLEAIDTKYLLKALAMILLFITISPSIINDGTVLLFFFFPRRLFMSFQVAFGSPFTSSNFFKL